MARLQAIEAEGKARELLEPVQTRGRVSNMLKTMAGSPATLEGYMALSRALKKGSLPARLREEIAVFSAERHRCEYCLAAHVESGQKVGLSEEELAASRQGQSADPKEDAALHFVTAVLETQGQVSDEDVQRVREAGYSEGEVSELVANAVLNLFTNYYNIVAETELDFQKVEFLTEGRRFHREGWLAEWGGDG